MPHDLWYTNHNHSSAQPLKFFSISSCFNMTTYSSSSTHMLELFSTNRLADETGLRAALCHLNALGGHSELQPAIEHLLSLPHVFAYIVSVWDRSAEMISQIMVDFPTDAQGYCSSLACKILDNVSVHALALPVRITNRLTSEIAEGPLTSTIIKIVNMDLVFILSLLSIKHRIFDPSLSSSPLSCSQPNCPKTCQIVMDSRYSIDTTFIHTAAHLISYPLSPFSVRRSVKPLRESRYSIPIQTPLPSASVFT